MTIGSDNNFFDEFEAASSEDWKKAAINALKGAAYQKVMFTETYDGITINPIYFKDNFDELLGKISQFPGSDDLTRGASASGQLACEKCMAQETPYALPHSYNAALKHDLECGQNSIVINLDHASQIHEEFTSEDLSYIDLIAPDLDEFEKAVTGLDLTGNRIFLNAGIAALPATALFKAYCVKNNIETNKLNISIGFDPLGSLAAEGNLPKSMVNFSKDLVDLAKFCKENFGEFHVVKINSQICHNAGSNLLQELAYFASCAVFYMKELISGGFTSDEAAKMIKFEFAVGTDFFMEIAKLRAARSMWSKIVHHFGGDPGKCGMFIHVFTSRRELTKYDPYVNLLRFTTEALSAVIGGCNALSVGFFDEAYGVAGEFSRRVSRNIQNVIKYESHALETIDTAGGSWYLENLTNELAQNAWAEFQKIDSLGGIIPALKTDYIQNSINAIYLNRLKNISSRKDTQLGTNKYANLHEKAVENNYQYDFDEMESHIENLMKRIDSRDTKTVYSKLDGLSEKYKSGDFMETAVECILAGATSGELFSALLPDNEKMEWVKPIIEKRLSENFDKLRDHAYEFYLDNGVFPLIDFLTIGTIKDYKARVDFSVDFFKTGGFENIVIEGNQDLNAAKLSVHKLENLACVICSSDKIYDETVNELAKEFKLKFPERKLILAGFPKEKIDEYRQAGIDEFIHIKADACEILKSLQDFYGIRK